MPHFYNVFKACIFLCLLFLAIPSFAQQNFSTEHYTAENGLPQNSIKSIAADADGFVWLATEDGLTRFDGRKFQVFGNNSTGAHTKRVISILPGQRNAVRRSRLNVLYVLFASDEMSKISNGRAMPVGNDLHLQKPTMDALRAEKKDIYYISGLPERWERTMLPEIPSLITDNYADGHFFLCDRNKVAYYQQWKKQYEIPNDAPARLNHFTLGGRLYYFDGRKTFTQISDNQRITFQAKGDILQNKHFAGGKAQIRIYWNNNSDQAFFYLDGQLFALVQERDGTLSTKLLTTGFDLIAQAIDVVFYDRESQKLFMGSSTNGLFVISIPQFETIKVSGNGRPNIFYAQVPYDENSVLTPTGIVAGKDPRTGKMIDRRLPEIEKLQSDDRRFLFKDRQGNTWTKSGNTLIKLDQKNQVTGSWKFKNGVKAVCQGSDSEFWIGVYEVGIFKLSTSNIPSEPAFIGGDSAKHITCMSIKNAGELWVGTLNGLYTVDTRNGRSSLVSGTAGFNVKSIQPDGKGRFWVTAQDQALMFIDSNRQIITFPLDKHGFLGSAHYVFHDGNGFLWIPTNRGLFQIKASDMYAYAGRHTGAAAGRDTNALAEQKPFYLYHSVNEGFTSNEFNGGCSSCGLKLGNGYVSLPSIDGLVWFKPENIGAHEPAGKFILDQVLVDGRPLQATGDTIRLPLRPKNVKLVFSTAYFGNRSNLEISYSLAEEGKQTAPLKWQAIDEDDHDIVIPFSSIPSGKYVLTIRKPAGFGLNNFTSRQFTIIVPEAWYEKGWLHWLLGILLLLGGFRVWRIRFKKIETRNQLLEMQVSVRTEELRQTLLTLETSQDDLLQQFHLQSRLLTSMAHDLRSPLSAAMFVTGEVTQLINHQEYEKAILLNQKVQDAVGLIKQSIDELLTYVKVQVYNREVKMEKVALTNLIDKSFNLYAKTTRINANSFENNVPGNITVFTNPQLLDILIRNLTDNANKFTENGIISAHWGLQHGSPALTIRDTGKGLPAGVIEWLGKTGAAPTPENFNGLGLVIVRELAPFALVRLSIHSGKDGTQVTLIFSGLEYSATAESV